VSLGVSVGPAISTTCISGPIVYVFLGYLRVNSESILGRTSWIAGRCRATGKKEEV
jgi:hypothetical protein